MRIRVVVTSVAPSGAEKVLSQSSKDDIVLTRSDKIQIAADLSDSAISVGMSRNKAFMDQCKSRVNDNGLVFLLYYFLSRDTLQSTWTGLEENPEEPLYCEDPTFHEISLTNMKPGNYLLYVSAVGAAHEQKNENGKYSSNTFWTSYPLRIE